MFRIALLAFAPLLAGCFNASPRPLTTETIRIVSNTRIQSASVTFPDGTKTGVPPDDYELFRQLFRRLAPVKTTYDGPGLPGLPDYQLMLFAAGNVANIGVMVRDDGSLTYSLDEFHYDGGDADAFVAAADAIRSRLAPQ
ncbi:hypothetical protein V7x_56070 [Crateriforma conspicua]|uniref:Lipoprotein n=1 Tax=Crateriforma conspicua TaxID=2527996 RepID=A0A5C6FFI6_9PLAN|nr:hypothetical protein [Crateriforma conspicua]TWT65685.1 hypothetical protein Pan14r_52340 [Crateriforma conspicua]TWU59507.1 hypothetical protein V7x_56070 [Crateriforma conspicua]